jgi:hypothetical protein
MVAFQEVDRVTSLIAKSHGWKLIRGLGGIPCNRCFRVTPDVFVKKVESGLLLGCPQCIKKSYEKEIRYWKGEPV